MYADGIAARAPSEPSIGGIMPEEYLDQQLLLQEWLMSELPDGVLDAPIRVPLTGQDRRDIANDTRPPSPPTACRDREAGWSNDQGLANRHSGCGFQLDVSIFTNAVRRTSLIPSSCLMGSPFLSIAH